MSSGIYKITNPNGKIYIGKSWNIEKRWNQYKSLQCKTQPILYASFQKYGVDKHVFEIQEKYDGKNKYKLSTLEAQWYYIYLQDGYVMMNCIPPVIDKSDLQQLNSKRWDYINEKADRIKKFMLIMNKLIQYFHYKNKDKFCILLKKLITAKIIVAEINENYIVIGNNEYGFSLKIK